MNLPLNTDLTGKVAVVTGAAGTLCSVFSKALAASGAKVALLGRTYANVQKLADEITAEGGTAKAYECNVLDKAAVMACHVPSMVTLTTILASQPASWRMEISYACVRYSWVIPCQHRWLRRFIATASVST